MDSAEHELILPPVNQDNICLPLSINTVSKYWNVDIPLSEALNIAKKYPNMRGSILAEGIDLATKHGLSSCIINSSMSELKQFIDSGIPPIVILPGIDNVVQHASVLSGYNSLDNTITHHIPSSESTDKFYVGVIPESQFSNLWNEDGQICILIAPSEILDTITKKKSNDKSNQLCFLSEKKNLLGENDESISLLKEALVINPKNITAMSLYAALLNEKNSFECIEFYEKSISLNNRYYLGYRGLGNYYLKAGQYDTSEKYYTSAIEINPFRFGPIYKNRGLVRYHQSNISGAKEDFENYLKYTPSATDRQNIIKELKDM